MCRSVCESACGHGENFSFVFTLPVYVRMWFSAHLWWRLFWNVRHSWRSFRSVRQSASYFPLTSLCSLYWPWYPLSSLESTPVSILVPKQVDCNMCRFCKPSSLFFFCEDGSDRLMKRASYSCCNFLCVELADTYLKYRRCRLSCLPFGWHFFFIVTHTHTHHRSKDIDRNTKKSHGWVEVAVEIWSAFVDE